MYLHGYYQSKSFIIANGLLGLREADKLKLYKKLRRKMLIPKIIGKIKNAGIKTNEHYKQHRRQNQLAGRLLRYNPKKYRRLFFQKEVHKKQS